jgi:hypothetical protein
MMDDVNELRDRAARWRQVAMRITDEQAIQALNDTAADLEETADHREQELALTAAADPLPTRLPQARPAPTQA